MAKRKATGQKKTPAKKGKLAKSKTLKVEVDTQENHSNYTEDVLDYLIKVMAEEDGITKQFLMLRMVNRQWKDAVDRVLRNSKALTIQIVFSKPLNADSESQIDYSTESWNTGDSDLPVLKSREFMHVNDIAADFNRLSSLNNSDYAFELKGPLICVTTQKLPAFISFLKRTVLVGVSCTGEPWTMNQTTLSLVYTDPYTFYVRKALFKECISAYESIIRLETLFTKIESLYLNITEFSIGSSTYHILYEKKFEPDDILPILCQNLMKSIAKRSGSALKKLDVSLPFCLKVFKGISSPLQQLVPQLEHLGLHYQKYNLNELLEKATEKLKSLKIRRQLEPENLKELEKILISKSTIFNGITSLVVTSSNIKLEKLLKHCKSVVFLKLYGDLPNHLSRNMEFDSKYFQLLKPMKSLKRLTLVDFDLSDTTKMIDELPEVTSLTIASGKPILENFRNDTQITKNGKYNIINVPQFVRVINHQFPKLELITMFGKVFEHSVVKQKLIDWMPEKTFQLHFCEYSRAPEPTRT